MNNETCFLWGNWRKASDVRRKEGKRCFFADCFAFVSCVLKCQAIKSFIKLYCIADTSVTYFSSLAFVSVLNSYILVWCEQEYNNCYSELCEELNDLFCVFLEVFPTFLFSPRILSWLTTAEFPQPIRIQLSLLLSLLSPRSKVNRNHRSPFLSRLSWHCVIIRAALLWL